MTTPVGAFDSYSAYLNYLTLSLQRTEQVAPWRDLYDQLEAYYLSNGLYEVLNSTVGRKTYLQSNGTLKPESMRPIYNPATRLVDFYGDLLWPGSLPSALQIQSDNEAIAPLVEQIWQWSNWGVEKDTAARWFPLFGSMFIKASTSADNSRVFLQNIKPRFVTDMDTDERGYLTWVRLDLPQTTRNADGKLETVQRTEVWEKGRYRVWIHKHTPETPLNELGRTQEDKPLTGYDFVPIVYQPFKSIGDDRGVGVYTLHLDKLDEIARMSTRLHQMLFRYSKPTWATVRSGVGADNRPLPPVQLSGGKPNVLERDEDDEILNLPGATDIKSLVAQLPYDQALAILGDQLTQLERDLPELVYGRIQESADLSGVALRYLLEGAINRLTAARGNAEAALIRAHQMALTIGQSIGLDNFRKAGTFENGGFAHEFVERPVLQMPLTEQAQTLQSFTSAGVPIEIATKLIGWTQEEIDELTKAKDAAMQKQQQMLNQAPGIAARLTAGANGTTATANRTPVTARQ